MTRHAYLVTFDTDALPVEQRLQIKDALGVLVREYGLTPAPVAVDHLDPDDMSRAVYIPTAK